MCPPVFFFYFWAWVKNFAASRRFYPKKIFHRFAAIYKETARIVYNIDRHTTRGYCPPQARNFLDSKRAFERFSSNFGLKITLQQPICWPAAGQIFWLPAFGRIFYPAASGRVKILPAGRPLGKIFYPIGLKKKHWWEHLPGRCLRCQSGPQ